MRIRALPGSLREASTNAALLRALARVAPPPVEIIVDRSFGALPIFSPDLEGERTPAVVEAFARGIAESDGLVISSPEYVRALPGGLKNAIDWLVSREEIIRKPVALLHASHRGDDAFETLGRVMGTVSQRFARDITARFHLISKTPEEIARLMDAPEHDAALRAFLDRFVAFIGAPDHIPE